MFITLIKVFLVITLFKYIDKQKTRLLTNKSF